MTTPELKTSIHWKDVTLTKDEITKIIMFYHEGNLCNGNIIPRRRLPFTDETIWEIQRHTSLSINAIGNDTIFNLVSYKDDITLCHAVFVLAVLTADILEVAYSIKN